MGTGAEKGLIPKDMALREESQAYCVVLVRQPYSWW